MIKELFATALAVFTITTFSVSAIASTVEVSTLQRLSHMPLNGGKINLHYDGQTFNGSVSSAGCIYQFSGVNDLSVRNQGPETFVKVYSNVVSSCLTRTERFYIDVIVAQTGKLELVRVYYRIGKTNHYLASCGSYASLTSRGVTCE